MKTKRAGELPRQPSEWMLRELPARSVVFLRAVGTHQGIRAALEAGGYGSGDHDEGLKLLLGVCQIRPGGFDPSEDDATRGASTELFDWLRTHVPRLRTALERLHPEALSLFQGSDTSDPARAALTAGTLLERLMALEARDPSAPALETLARRGLDRSERERLDALLRVTQSATRPNDETASPERARLTEHDTDLLALHRWYRDWTTTARTYVKRKDWLIRMGLAARQR